MSRTKDATNWTPDEIDRLRHMWEVEGLSATTIAEKLGRISRSAVLGKARRLGLAYRRVPGIRDKGRTLRSAGQMSKDRHMRRRILVKQKLLPVAPEAKPADLRVLRGAVWEPLPGSTPIGLMEVGEGLCRWPLGEGRPFLFCGLPTTGPYCEHHHALSVGQGTVSERKAA